MSINSTRAVHPLLEAFPPVNDAHFCELVKDIAAYGLQQPIVLSHDGTIVIDGRLRLKACDELGIEPTFDHLPEMSDVDLALHVISLNCRRRHMTVGQRAMVAVNTRHLWPMR